MRITAGYSSSGERNVPISRVTVGKPVYLAIQVEDASPNTTVELDVRHITPGGPGSGGLGAEPPQAWKIPVGRKGHGTQLRGMSFDVPGKYTAFVLYDGVETQAEIEATDS